MTKLLAALLSLLLLLSVSTAFTPSKRSSRNGVVRPPQTQTSSSSWSPLSMTIAPTATDSNTDSDSNTRNPPFAEDEARLLLAKAREYAYDDQDLGTLKEARFLLREMIHLQSGCVTGTLVGADLCDDQAGAADVVAHLRTKIRRLEQIEHSKHPHSR
jgi:hypothetical protein